MAGLLGMITSEPFDSDKNRILNSIDPMHNHQAWIYDNKGVFFAVTYRKKNPCGGNRYYESDKYAGIFHGDLVDYHAIPWDGLIQSIEKNDSFFLTGLNGIFCLAIFNKQEKKLFLLSDRRSQDPLFYSKQPDQFIFSTDISTFCRFNNAPAFDKKWLYEYMFFNYPVSDVTPIQNVHRIPDACIIIYDHPNHRITFRRYANKFEKRKTLLSGKNSLEYAYEIFKERIPKYYTDSMKGSTGVALTAGWDTRTCLAFAPDLGAIRTYTYGIPGCRDMTESKKLADFLGLHHTEIFFNQEFTSQLPELIDNTAFLSSGFNHIGRSSLLYTYSTLRERYDFDKIITGIFIDGNFRGHAHSPAFVSENLKKYFADNRFIEGKLGFNYYRPLLADSAHEYLLHMFNKLNNELGGLQTGEHHLLLHLYKGAPNIFAQEYKIADQFTTLRSPGFDNTLIELAFSIKESTLNFSQYMPGHRRGTHKEMILQAYILKKSNKLLARFPVRHASPEAVLHGKFYYLLNKYGNYFLYRMKNTGKNYIPLEDNNHWMNILYKDSIDRFVFNKNSFIHEFFSENFLSHLKEKRETHILMKIATVELLMNLLNNGWVSSKYISR